MTDPRQIGIFGGTFDPIHVGHLVLAEAIGHALGLERVVFYPAGSPPHKPGKPISAAADRYRMVELAIAGNDRFAISDLDMGDAPSYTVDLLREIKAGTPDATLEFIIGADSLRDFPTWHDPEGILCLCRLAVGSRPGVALDLAQISARVPALTDRLDLVQTPSLDISATDIRQRVRDGQSFRYLVPDLVWRFIGKRGLYHPTP